MRYLRAIIRRIISVVKLIFIKLLHPYSITVPFSGLVSANTHFNTRQGKIIIGKNYNTRRNVELTADKNAIITIGNNCFMNNNVLIASHENITIGNNCSFGPSVMIFDHDHDFRSKTGIKSRHFVTQPITIGDGVWLGANVIVLKGVTIGNNSVIGAGTVVSKDVPADSIVHQTDNLIIRSIKK